MLGYRCTSLAGDESSPFIFHLSGKNLYQDGVTFDSIVETRRKQLDAYKTVELSHSDFNLWRSELGVKKEV